jgi:hypothetical protein
MKSHFILVTLTKMLQLVNILLFYKTIITYNCFKDPLKKKELRKQTKNPIFAFDGTFDRGPPPTFVNPFEDYWVLTNVQSKTLEPLYNSTSNVQW